MPKAAGFAAIGQASLNQSRVSEAPTLDLAWAPDVAGALELPLNCFDGVILDAPNPETLEEDLGRLVGTSDLPPLLVHLPGGDGALAKRVTEAGAREVVLADQGERHPTALDLVERLERSSPTRRSNRTTRSSRTTAEPAIVAFGPAPPEPSLDPASWMPGSASPI